MGEQTDGSVVGKVFLISLFYIIRPGLFCFSSNIPADKLIKEEQQRHSLILSLIVPGTR